MSQMCGNASNVLLINKTFNYKRFREFPRPLMIETKKDTNNKKNARVTQKNYNPQLLQEMKKIAIIIVMRFLKIFTPIVVLFNRNMRYDFHLKNTNNNEK